MSVKIDRTQMKELPLADAVEPFAMVKYWDKPDGSARVIQALISLTMGVKAGLAIDGSKSMERLFGKPALGILPELPNRVRPVAQAMSAYLARGSEDGKVAVIYSATGPAGRDIQVLGDLTIREAEEFPFHRPDWCGESAQLLPALRYFTDGQQRKDLYNARRGMYVFITDGAIEDMDVVKQYCTQLAKDIDAGRRNDLKLVIIGLGDQVDEDQLDELDDLETGTDVDLWDTNLAAEMQGLSQICVVYDYAMIVVPGDGIIKDPSGNVVEDYRDRGLPALLRFALPPGAKSFSLEVAGRVFTQPLP